MKQYGCHMPVNSIDAEEEAITNDCLHGFVLNWKEADAQGSGDKFR